MRDNTLNKNSQNKILFVAPRYGCVSETWMGRQANGMNSRVLFACNDNESREGDSRACEVVEIPYVTPSSRVGNVLRRGLNATRGFYRGSVEEAKWWKVSLRKWNPDITLFHYGTTSIRYSSMFRAFNQPYAIHFNGFDLSSRVLDPRYTRNIVRAANRSSALIVVANYMRDWLIEQGVSQSLIHHIPYGVPLNNFSPGDADTPKQCRFLAVGRLTEKKAPELTIRAFAACIKTVPNCHLTVIGDGTLLEKTKSLALELGVADAISFMGGRPANVVQQSMREASVFVQHSITPESGDKEGWPVAVGEAAASGLPIVSTRHASIPEQVVHGESGLLCEEGDWQGMADHMIKLASSYELRCQFGKRARQHISQWSTDGQVSKLEQTLIESIA